MFYSPSCSYGLHTGREDRIQAVETGTIQEGWDRQEELHDREAWQGDSTGMSGSHKDPRRMMVPPICCWEPGRKEGPLGEMVGWPSTLAGQGWGVPKMQDLEHSTRWSGFPEFGVPTEQPRSDTSADSWEQKSEDYGEEIRPRQDNVPIGPASGSSCPLSPPHSQPRNWPFDPPCWALGSCWLSKQNLKTSWRVFRGLFTTCPSAESLLWASLGRTFSSDALLVVPRESKRL